MVGGLLGLVVGKLIVDKLKEQRASAAVHELYQLLASKSDPGSLTADEVCQAARSPALQMFPMLPICSCQPGSVSTELPASLKL